MSSSAMVHIKVLADEIGPRGSTTPQERQASAYARQHFAALGLQTYWEEFTAPQTGWRPFSVAALSALLGVLLFWLGGELGALSAAILMVITLVSVFCEMYFQPNLLRLMMPKGRSQNVWARIRSVRPAKRRVLVVGHIDTHRTPWVFTTPTRLAFFQRLTTVTLITMVAATVLYLLSLFLPLGSLRWFALAAIPIYLTTLVVTWQADMTPYTPGANDNGSGAAVVLSLAARLARMPLQQVEVWALCSGCEEVGSHGVQAFVQKHRAELAGLLGISVDNVGGQGAGVCYTHVEGMVIPYRPSPELLGLADQIQVERPDLHAYSQSFTTLHTDATCLMVNRVPSLSFVGLTPAGNVPNWHQVTDTLPQIDAKAVEHTEEFILELLQRLDAQSQMTANCSTRRESYA